MSTPISDKVEPLLNGSDAQSQPTTPRRSTSSSVDFHRLTQTPNRFSHQFNQFRRTLQAVPIDGSVKPLQADLIQEISPINRSYSQPVGRHGRRHSWQHTSRDQPSLSAAPITDIHEYLAVLQRLRDGDDHSIATPQYRAPNSDLVANFQSLAQQLSLTLQERDLRNRTAVKQQRQPESSNQYEPITSAHVRPILDDLLAADANEQTVGGDHFNNRLEKSAREVETDVHLCDLVELQNRLATDLKEGLSMQIVRQRQLESGINLITPPSNNSSLVYLFAREMLAGFNPILIGAFGLALVAWQVGDPPDITNLGLAVMILLVIILSSSFSCYQAKKSNSIITAFGRMLPSFAVVHREGRDQQVLATDLVVGDIVRIKMGQCCPADVRLIECESLQVNNSNLTGESEPVNCTTNPSSQSMLESTNIAFYSSLIVGGTGTGVVVNTGDRTVLGRVSALTSADRGQSNNLERQIRRFAVMICTAALITAIVCFISWIAWLHRDYPDFMSLPAFIVNVIGLVVAYLPTGLPLALSLILTFVATRLYSKKVLAKNLSVVESFNQVSMILSDKTGTLTCNQLTVVSTLHGSNTSCQIPEVAVVDRSLCTAVNEAFPYATDVSDSRSGSQDKQLPITVFPLMLKAACLCNNAALLPKGITPEQAGDPAVAPIVEVATAVNSSLGALVLPELELHGDAVDIALAEFAMKYSVDVTDQRARHPRVRSMPFNSKVKLMASINVINPEELDSDDQSINRISHSRRDDTKHRYIVYLKGAPELVLSRCSHWSDDQGQPELLDNADNPHARSTLIARQEANGAKGYRVIALAYQTLSQSQLDSYSQSEQSRAPHQAVSQDLQGFPSAGYTFVGFFCMLDPPRAGVSEAVSKAWGAGISTSMITGDAPSTALAIARQTGIVGVTQQCVRLKFTHSRDAPITVHLQGDDDSFTHHHTIGHIDADMSLEHTKQPAAENSCSLWVRFKGVFTRSNSAETRSLESNSSSLLSVVIDSGTPSSPGRPVSETLKHAVVVTGSDLNYFDKWMWDFTLAHSNLVFARISPEQKLKIVFECQRRGICVSVTGDGVNDAPALRRADIGISMMAGAEVAREASDMVLCDNNFVSVIEAIETGRLVSENLKKCVIYLLPAGSCSELLPILANFFLGVPLPLSAFLMIVICMLTDLGPSLALVNETPEGPIMLRKPAVKPKLVDWKLLVHAYLFIGMIESFAGFLCFFLYFNDNGIPPSALVFAFDKYRDGYMGKTQDELDNLVFTGQSIFFVSLVITQFANLLASRTRTLSFFQHNPFYGPAKNLWLFVGIISSVVIAIVITQVSFFHEMFDTRPVPVESVMPALGFAAALFIADEARKWCVRNYPESKIAQMAW